MFTTLQNLMQPSRRRANQMQRATTQQVENNAGGYVFQIDALKQARRFAVLGVTESGTFYARGTDIMQQNLACIDELVRAGRSQELIDMLVEISDNGLAPRQDPVVMLLAYLSLHADAETRKAAFAAAPRILRTPTVMFDFVFKWRKTLNGAVLSHGAPMQVDSAAAAAAEAAAATPAPKKSAGWGRGMRRCIADYYLNTPVSKLLYHAAKYKRRNGVSHRDLLRCAHPKVAKHDWARQFAFAYMGNDGKCDAELLVRYAKEASSDAAAIDENDELVTVQVDAADAAATPMETPKPRSTFAPLAYVKAVHEAERCQSEQRLVELIVEHNLVRENINTAMLNSVPVWNALLQRMPLNALLRNLGKMSSIGMFERTREQRDARAIVVKRITDERAIEAARLHPLNVYAVSRMYELGHGRKGKLSWTANHGIMEALEQCMYTAFKYAPSCGKRLRVCLDVSGSMGCAVMDGSLTAYDASAIMSLALSYAEGRNASFCAFSHTLRELPISSSMTLAEVRDAMRLPMGATDCALPMLDALERKAFDIDAFIVFTDNETWYGQVHPFEALRQYRAASGRTDAKLIVCAMTPTKFSIADPNDVNMLDIVGLDASTPRLIADFCAGRL